MEERTCIGIIAEFDPFHRGHAHLIAQAKAALPGAPVVCAMSGPFTQRGEAAIVSKYARAEMAVRCGADLVVELPVQWAVSSAESFARGGVQILHALGVTHLAFGSESGDLTALQIVAQEIGIDKSAETIKAQCVIARTNLYDAMQAGTKEPESMPPDQQQELWGENFDKNYQKLKSCVEATAGETLLYNRTYIYAAYHAISSGRTRSMSELYEDADMPYLVTAECHADTTAEGYLSVFYYEKEEFLEKCRAAYPDAGLTELTQIEIVSRDAAEYVTKIKVAGETYDGEQFRHALELPSACFTITEIDDHVRIVARGMGHGFGLSQNTAEKLAKEGYGYREILAYFYKGAVIGQAGNL